MSWISTADALPQGDVLIYSEGSYFVAALVGGDSPAFVDAHSADLLAWPSHWMALPAPPG